MHHTGWARRILYACLLAIIALAGAPLHAEDNNVTVGVGDNSLTVQGTTSPSAFVTISEDGNVIGTTTANASGVFTQTFPAQNPGLHEIKVFAQTTNGLATDVVTINVNITEHATTTVDVFLPPTIMIAYTNLSYGEPLQLSGQTCPLCTLTFYIDNSSHATTIADSSGQWQVSIATIDLAAGQHSVFARATNGSGAQSYSSTLRSFQNATSREPGQPPIGALSIQPPAVNQRPGIPVITFPLPGTVWTSPTITLRGSADPGAQVEVFDGGKSLGSAWADDNGHWSLTLGLESRDYSLRARACRGNLCSDFSETLQFTAQPPSTGLILELQKTLFSTIVNDPITLQAFIKNGRPPYKVIINWGEAKTTGDSTQNQTEVKIKHTYAKAGRYTGWIEVQDIDNRAGRVYFTVNVTSRTNFIPWILIVILLSLILIYVIWRLVRRKSKPKDGRR